MMSSGLKTMFQYKQGIFRGHKCGQMR
uniref:Uncharacterized protein n=1 Tax=Anguilla anguilla TaxID=7936 RepID=A0A0E9VDV2_ANGAN